tara:strand:- start:21407 stop:22606 length:1200 start_codon:yes stop_codon:yes gene_type:complete
MDNFGVKKNDQKNNHVENDHYGNGKMENKKNSYLGKKKWITSEFEMLKIKYGCYYCCFCDFDTKNLKDFKRHLKTKKHEKKTPKKTPNIVTRNSKRYECICGKDYKFASGLSKHKAKCEYVINSNLTCQKKSKKTKNGYKKFQKNGFFVENQLNFTKKKDNNVMVTITNQQNTLKLDNDNNVGNEYNLSEFVKQSLNQTETINKLLEQNSVLIEKLNNKQTNNITYQNCGNKKMTINVYLNEKCKDAMNLSDFVNNLNISIEDLLYTQQHGYMKGISNIFVKHLKNLDPNVRPIHCCDKRRLHFFVKDEDKWQKDKQNKKIDKSIHDLSIKQIKQLREWENQNPNYLQDENLLSQWQKLVHQIMGPSDRVDRDKDKEQIIKKLGTTTELKENLIITKKN